jgi:Asp/Glu/hydantoin racemase
MWHAFNLISEGDQVRSSTIRKVSIDLLGFFLCQLIQIPDFSSNMMLICRFKMKRQLAAVVVVGCAQLSQLQWKI